MLKRLEDEEMGTWKEVPLTIDQIMELSEKTIGSTDPLEDERKRLEYLHGIDEDPAHEDRSPLYIAERIHAYELFRDRIYTPAKVLYPGCDMDASPVKAFPNSMVTLIDRNKNAVNSLKRHGINAVCANMYKFQSNEQFDLLILLNPQFPSSLAVPLVSERGYVLANDYHGNASQITEMSGYEYLGSIEMSSRIPPQLKLGGSLEINKIDDFYIFRKR